MEVGADGVTHAVLSALGLRDSGLLAPPGPGTPRSPLERLVGALAGRPMLLILDNCEHVIDDAARLAGRLLAACPSLRILATSREPLGLTGETLCPVPTLELPPDGATPAEALACPAVRLFADRAAAVRPGFALDGDADTLDAVVRICRTLDGLPLAIELAAARLRALPVAEVAAGLDDRFRLLSRGSRTADARHRTLRATVAWSWELLDPRERALARRLTVFVGGVTIDAAAAVCMGDVTLEPVSAAHRADAADALTGLADKSLIEAEPGARRFRMLETVRAYCAERLEESDERIAVERAHAAYFLDLARTADPHLRGTEQMTWLRRLDPERENIRAAVRRGVDSAGGPDLDLAPCLISAMSAYWWLRGLRGDAALLAREVLARVGVGQLGAGQLGSGLVEEYVICLLTAMQGRIPAEEHATYLRAAQAMLPQLTGPPRQPLLHVLWATAAGPPSEDVRDTLVGSPPAGDPWSDALTNFGFGLLSIYSGQTEAAQAWLTAGLARFQALGERWGITMCLADLARLAHWRGDRTRFLTLVDEALNVAGQLDSADDMASLLCLRGEGSVRAGDLTLAAADFERAASLARRAGAPESLGAAQLGLGEVARLSGDLETARWRLDRALEECPPGSFGATETRWAVMVALGRVAEAHGDAGTARKWHTRVLAEAANRDNTLVTTITGAVEGLAGASTARRTGSGTGRATARRGSSATRDGSGR